jgi:hypothetical protein
LIFRKYNWWFLSTLKIIQNQRTVVMVYLKKQKIRIRGTASSGYYLFQTHQRTDSFLSMKELVKSRPVKNALFGNFNFFEEKSSMPKLVFWRKKKFIGKINK